MPAPCRGLDFEGEGCVRVLAGMEGEGWEAVLRRPPSCWPMQQLEKTERAQHTPILEETDAPTHKALNPIVEAVANHLSKHRSKQFSGPLKAGTPLPHKSS